MNSNNVKNDWDIQKAKLKQKFIKLTDSDLLFIEGKKEAMLERLAVTLGKSKEEITIIISKL